MRFIPIGRRVYSMRRKAFGFEKSNYDETVELPSPSGPVTIPLEAQEIGSFCPSIIPFNEALLDILACPISGEELKFDRDRNILVSEATGYAFPINKAGIPIFLKKWAIKL